MTQFVRTLAVLLIASAPVQAQIGRRAPQMTPASKIRPGRMSPLTTAVTGDRAGTAAATDEDAATAAASTPRGTLGVLAVADGIGQPATAAAAQDGGDARRSKYDRIWTFAKWYENSSNPVVQKVLFSGRYQHDYSAIDASQGRLGEWNVRRMRLGPKVTFLHSWLFHAEVELNPQEADPLYVRFTDFYVQWTARPDLELTVGKHGVAFTMDGATSSKELLTMDRSALSNNIWFPQEYIPGVSVSGEPGKWIYRAGVYSAGTANREFGEFDGGTFALAAVGYDVGGALGVKKAVLQGNYVYQQPDPANTFTRQLQHVGSVNLSLDTGRWGVRADLSAASGYLGQRDLLGAMVMPFVSVTDKLQLVARYTLVKSDGLNGVRLGTYESHIVSGRGDRYNEGYVGANYYFYGHKLKLQSGLQFANMRDRAGDGGAYSGVAWTNGLRVSW